MDDTTTKPAAKKTAANGDKAAQVQALREQIASKQKYHDEQKETRQTAEANVRAAAKELAELKDKLLDLLV